MAAELAERVGARIRERRGELDLTQEDVARALPGRTSGNQVSRWERGANRPGDTQLEHLAEVLKVDVSYFMVDDKPAETPDLVGALGGHEAPEWAARLQSSLDDIAQRVANIESVLSGAPDVDEAVRRIEQVEAELAKLVR